MSDIYDVLEAFLGVDLREKKPPPRRRVRPPGETGTERAAPPVPARSAGTAPAPAREIESLEAEAEKNFRRFFGIPDDEEMPNRDRSVDSSSPPTTAKTPLANQYGPAPILPAPEIVDPGKSAKASRLSDVASLAAGLRGSPSAARNAFVYAEIFGPPLADR